MKFLKDFLKLPSYIYVLYFLGQQIICCKKCTYLFFNEAEYININIKVFYLQLFSFQENSFEYFLQGVLQ